MAYFNLFASVPVSQVEEIRIGQRAHFSPSSTSGASHLLAYWVTQQPLGQYLCEALDGGEVIQSGWTHRLRVPLVHFPQTVRRLAEVISTQAQLQIADDDWLTAECQRLIRVLRHASDLGECILSILDIPHEPESGQELRLFWQTKDGAKVYSLYQKASLRQRMQKRLKSWLSFGSKKVDPKN